jgi:drug/metabolite transporter (DMT)-like permease
MPRLSAFRGAVILVVTTALWGSSFVLIKRIYADIPAAPICAVRFVVALVVLSPFIRFDRKTWRNGLELGLWLFAGFATQTIGLKYTTVNRSAFITAMNVIFVPMFAAIAGHRVSRRVWIAAIIALGGCGLLCGEGGGFNIGDIWTFGTAIVFGLYIFRLEILSADCPALPLSFVQLVPVALISIGWTASAPQHIIAYHWPTLIYLGLGATAATTCMQAMAQQVVPAPQAAVIFTLEPVFAAIFGYLILGEHLAPSGLVGAALIIFAAIICQTGNRSGSVSAVSATSSAAGGGTPLP